MKKKKKENFKNSTKCLIRDNDYIDNDVKERDHCNIIDSFQFLSSSLNSLVKNLSNDLMI